MLIGEKKSISTKVEVLAMVKDIADEQVLTGMGQVLILFIFIPFAFLKM